MGGKNQGSTGRRRRLTQHRVFCRTMECGDNAAPRRMFWADMVALAWQWTGHSSMRGARMADAAGDAPLTPRVRRLWDRTGMALAATLRPSGHDGSATHMPCRAWLVPSLAFWLFTALRFRSLVPI